MKTPKRIPSYYGKNIAQNAQRKFLKYWRQRAQEARETGCQSGAEKDRKDENR